MTTLTIYRATGGAPVKPATSDINSIVRELKAIDIGFERWPTRAIPAAADAKVAMEIYASEIEKLNKSYGFASVDAIRMRPGAPNAAAVRAKYLDEHTHDDDEVRFFVEGSGAFYLHKNEHVYQIVCTEGDLISVPRGTLHWADLGPEPDFTVIRFFTSPNGWEAIFTGDQIAKRIPLYEPKAA